MSLICTELSLRRGIDFRFDRSLILAGQWWRILTGPLVHLNEIHFVANMTAFALIEFFYSDHLSARRVAIALVVIQLSTTALLLTVPFGWNWYMGFSGILHGLFALGAILAARRDRRFYLLLATVVVKAICEVGFGNTDSSVWGMPVASLTHLYGVASGAALAVFFRSAERT